MNIEGFYKKMLSLPHKLGEYDEATPFKCKFLENLIQNRKVYKFVSTDYAIETVDKINKKLSTLERKKIWFSYYGILNDSTEFQIEYDKNIINKIGESIGIDADFMITSLKEVYDVYALTYEYSDTMWNAYASSGNGYCVEMEVSNYDMLYPIEYIDKDEVDYTNMIKDALLQNDLLALGMLPWVIKNPYNFDAKLDSTKEKEIRLLHSVWDFKEVDFELKPDCKRKNHYIGIEEPYEDFGLKISRIIIGDKCNEGIKQRLHFIADKNNCVYEYR